MHWKSQYQTKNPRSVRLITLSKFYSLLILYRVLQLESNLNRKDSPTLTYFRELYAETRIVNRCKLMLVGDGGVGKTSLGETESSQFLFVMLSFSFFSQDRHRRGFKESKKGKKELTKTSPFECCDRWNWCKYRCSRTHQKTWSIEGLILTSNSQGEGEFISL